MQHQQIKQVNSLSRKHRQKLSQQFNIWSAETLLHCC